jgi:protein-disulfide isomerase
LVISLLILTAAVILNACVVPTVMPPEDATASAQVSSNVEATVDTAIALAVKATLTSVAADDGTAASTTDDEGETVAVATTSSTEDDAAATPATEPAESTEGPMLITPTPDRSAEIMEIILQNTRHFRGNPDASVVIVEFSDFL